MTKSSKRYVFCLFILLLMLLALLLPACIAGRQLTTGHADRADLQGTYTLMLYGCHYPADIKNVAIMIAEGSRYPLEIYDTPTSYRVKKGVPGPQALKEAESFVRCSVRRVDETQLRRIVDDAGGTIGYEVRPLYSWWEFGMTDVLLVSYSLQEGTVRTYIRLDPDMERSLESVGPDRHDLPVY
jgi:hypothetical protein